MVFAVGILGVDWSNTFTLASALIGLMLGLFAIGGVVYGVVRAGQLTDLKNSLTLAKENAESWEGNYKAERVKTERLTGELLEQREAMTELRVAFAKQLSAEQFEQRELQHALQAEKDAAEKEASVLRNLRDTTEVLKGVEEILAQLARSKDVTTQVVAELLSKAEERAAIRDSTLIATQREIVAQLKRLADQIVGQVAEVMQEKVDQLNPDLPSPDRQE